MQSVFADVPYIAEQLLIDKNNLDKIIDENKHIDLLSGVIKICENYVSYSDKNPSDSSDAIHNIIENSEKELIQIQNKTSNQNVINEAKNIIASAILACAINYCNSENNWDKGVTFLKLAIKYAKSRELILKILHNLAVIQKNKEFYRELSPLKESHELQTFNGIGFTIYKFTLHSKTKWFSGNLLLYNILASYFTN